MVSFSCENCGDVLTKKKLDPHRNRCHGATFTCIDCMVYFHGTDYRSHTSCMSEEQKYQGALYKPKKEKGTQGQRANSQNFTNTPNNTVPPAAQPSGDMAHLAYVEDAPEDIEQYRDLTSDDDDAKLRAGPLPRAPTPPPPAAAAAADDADVNVFDFLVANPTPKASNSDLRKQAAKQEGEGAQLVRFEYGVDAFLDTSGDAEDESQGLVRVPASKLVTPAPKSKKTKDGDKKDKKRKRLHVDTSDLIMTDAPPMLHSGLTGGLKGLMSGHAVFPPSPEYSADAAETPASPLKKSRHSKHSKSRTEGGIGNNLISMMTSKPKTKKRKHGSSPETKKHRHKHRRHKSDSSEKPEKLETGLLEYNPTSKDSKSKEKSEDNNAVVMYNPKRPGDLLLSLVNKGPESEKGCSLNKALKRYHRERSVSGSTGMGKLMEEKDLFRSLRMRKNERGEIVLFCV